MARPTHGKDRVTTQPSEPTPSAPEDASPSEPKGQRLFWMLVVAVWVGAVLLLWGTEIVGLIYRMFSVSPG